MLFTAVTLLAVIAATGAVAATVTEDLARMRDRPIPAWTAQLAVTCLPLLLGGTATALWTMVA